MPRLLLEDARWTLIHDTAKRCAQSLVAYPLGDVDDAAASHFLSLCQPFRALFALASDHLDDITNGLDDLVALQDLSLAGKRVLARQVRGANLERAAACAELGPCCHRCMALLASDLLQIGPKTCALDRLHGDLKLLQPSLATEVVAECLTKCQGSVFKFWSNLTEARETQDPLLEHLQQFRSQLKEFELVHQQLAILPDILAESATILRRAEHRELLWAGTAHIIGRFSFRRWPETWVAR